MNSERTNAAATAPQNKKMTARRLTLAKKTKNDAEGKDKNLSHFLPFFIEMNDE
jgi:hypothetical protein